MNKLGAGSNTFKIDSEKMRLLEAYAHCNFDNVDETKQKFKMGKRVKPQSRIDEFDATSN